MCDNRKKKEKKEIDEMERLAGLLVACCCLNEGMVSSKEEGKRVYVCMQLFSTMRSGYP